MQLPDVPEATMANLRSYPHLATAAEAWRRSLPQAVAGLVALWRLQLSGEPMTGGSWGFVLPCVTEDGREVVLKLCPDHERLGAEHAALTAWSGGPAVQVLAHYPGIMLLDRLRPAGALTDLTHDEQVQLLRQLAVAPQAPSALLDFRERVLQRTVQRVTMMASSARIPDAGRLVRMRADETDRAAASCPDAVCHGDLHADNVLDHHGRPTVIDPFGIRGPREIDVSSCAINFSEPGEDLQARIVSVAESTGSDPAVALSFGRLYALLEAVHHRAAKTRHADRSEWLMAFARSS